MSKNPLHIMWISHFPVEWLDPCPPDLAGMPKGHPTTWQRVLWGELREDARYRFHMVTLNKQAPRNLSWTDGNTTFYVLKTRGGLRAPSYFWYDTWLIRRLVHRVRPDLVHAWGAERGAGLVASRLDVPYLVTVQGLMSWYVQAIPSGMHHRLAAFVERQVFGRAPLVTTESRFACDFIRRIAPALRIEQIEHAPAWLFHRLPRRPMIDPARFLYVGTLDQRKGLDTLLHALDRMNLARPWELAVTGSPEHPYAQALKLEISSATWNRIRFLGNLTASAVAEEFSRALMLIFPTRADTSPNAVKEAAVAGVPVIGTHVGGIPDYITDGKNGLLVEPGDPDSLAHAIRAALDHPRFSQGEVDEENLVHVRDYLSPRTMATRFSALYDEYAQASVRPV
ncbi:MAG TPA: glycosyltransferase family 4 protein [Kiritimatiellia bacterium]|nr:glycosyltransferase family 4 protein [Kiritimatiellia bacterium]